MEKVNPKYIHDNLKELYPDAKCALNYSDSYSLLISIILSAQTTDKAVNKVTPILFNKYKNFNELSKADIKDVISIIKEIGLYKNKAINIIETSKIISNDNLEIVPNDFSYLIKLPGVGRKTANVFLAEYYNEQTFGVDTHIYRVSKRLNITDIDSDVIKTEQDLIKLFKDYSFKEMHHLLISFGRNICKSKNPSCDICPFNNICKK